MATAGGAKMEPASCAKQSRSRNALRCLRSVPLVERHSAGKDVESGRKGAWLLHVVPPRAALTSRGTSLSRCRRAGPVWASLLSFPPPGRADFPSEGLLDFECLE